MWKELKMIDAKWLNFTFMKEIIRLIMSLSCSYLDIWVYYATDWIFSEWLTGLHTWNNIWASVAQEVERVVEVLYLFPLFVPGPLQCISNEVDLVWPIRGFKAPAPESGRGWTKHTLSRKAIADKYHCKKSRGFTREMDKWLNG